ncbi:unnamed protein product [Phyllotreta striolata]|uniref:Ubiquitin-like domain-containing protein n=1 Tax=Phyllotreta striolata TaxID=444603 RepID=A0A9N9TW79_PHYSR|nr:unnamed protein product [Phyllotreta striolata]
MDKTTNNKLTCSMYKQFLEEQYGLPINSYYILMNGKIVDSNYILNDSNLKCLQIIPRILGGKGGFGSMLRAIGAQIEKTTNREACRDLSGRRLRDINEEQRLKKWINQQAEREKEAKERKKKKLEKLCEPPKHEFKDSEYDKERSALPELVEDAVVQGMQASSSKSVVKRKHEETETNKKKKRKFWVDDEMDDISSGESDDGDDDNEVSSSSEKNTEQKSVQGSSKTEVSPDTTSSDDDKTNSPNNN